MSCNGLVSLEEIEEAAKAVATAGDVVAAAAAAGGSAVLTLEKVEDKNCAGWNNCVMLWVGCSSWK